MISQPGASCDDSRHLPRLGIGAGVVDGDLDIDPAELGTGEAFDDVGLLGSADARADRATPYRSFPPYRPPGRRRPSGRWNRPTRFRRRPGRAAARRGRPAGSCGRCPRRGSGRASESARFSTGKDPCAACPWAGTSPRDRLCCSVALRWRISSTAEGSSGTSSGFMPRAMLRAMVSPLLIGGSLGPVAGRVIDARKNRCARRPCAARASPWGPPDPHLLNLRSGRRGEKASS